jgi:Protein of unknown function (DUF3309)
MVAVAENGRATGRLFAVVAAADSRRRTPTGRARRVASGPYEGHAMGLILLIVLIVLLLGSVPNYPYSRNWGYGP